MTSSPDTVLRRVKLGPSLPVSAAKAIGVDDWAWRKGHCYGTILVDLESHVPIRWNEGCHNATALWHEIKEQGYTGGRSTMIRYVATLRTSETKYFRQTAAPRQPKVKTLSPRQAAMLLARRAEKLDLDEQQLLKKLNECCLEIPILYKLTQGFAGVFRNKQIEDLHTWIDEARRTDLPELGRFCDELLRDIKAVTAAVILPWSNGQSRGEIHRLKLVKRQMYGRAKFNLLRRRVLPYVPTAVTLSPKHAP